MRLQHRKEYRSPPSLAPIWQAKTGRLGDTIGSVWLVEFERSSRHYLVRSGDQAEVSDEQTPT